MSPRRRCIPCSLRAVCPALPTCARWSIAAWRGSSSAWRSTLVRSIRCWLQENFPNDCSHRQGCSMTLVTRETKETTIRCEILKGTGHADVATGQPFLDHMLVVLAKYSGLDLSVQ